MATDLSNPNKVLLSAYLLMPTFSLRSQIMSDPSRHYSVAEEKQNLPTGEHLFTIVPSSLPQIRNSLKATTNIPENTPVGEVIGLIENSAHYKHREENNPSGERLGLELSAEEGLVIDLSQYGNFAKYLRHSCNPNLTTSIWCDATGVPRMTLVTTRDVQQGDTLTINLKAQFCNKDLPIPCNIYKCKCQTQQDQRIIENCSEIDSSDEEMPLETAINLTACTPVLPQIQDKSSPNPPANNNLNQLDNNVDSNMMDGDNDGPSRTLSQPKPDQTSNFRELGVPVGSYHLRPLLPPQMQSSQGSRTSSSSSSATSDSSSSSSSPSSNSNISTKPPVGRPSLSPATKERLRNMARGVIERIQNKLPRTNPIEARADEITPNRPPTALSPPVQETSRRLCEEGRRKVKNREEAPQAMPPQSDLSGSAGTVANCEATYSASIAPPFIPTPQFPFTTETTSAASKKKVLKTLPTKTPAKKTQMPSKKTQPKKKQVSGSTPKSKQPTIKRSINPDLSFGICYEVFATKKLLATHVKKRHPKRCFMCPHCYNTYCRASSLKRHIEEIHKTNSTTCLQCGLVSPSKRDHLKHLKEHQNQKKCPHHHCHYRSSDMQKLLDHIHDTHAPRTSKSSNRNNLESSSSTGSSSKSESD